MGRGSRVTLISRRTEEQFINNPNGSLKPVGASSRRFLLSRLKWTERRERNISYISFIQAGREDSRTHTRRKENAFSVARGVSKAGTE